MKEMIEALQKEHQDKLLFLDTLKFTEIDKLPDGVPEIIDLEKAFESAMEDGNKIFIAEGKRIYVAIIDTRTDDKSDDNFHIFIAQKETYDEVSS